LLECIGIEVLVLSQVTTLSEFLVELLPRIQKVLESGKQIALVCRKNAIAHENKHIYVNDYTLSREKALEVIISNLGSSVHIVSTTGKLSRELFELREKRHESHSRDFLVVGSMGHTSMIGAGIAASSDSHATCILDGDGSVIMHMGSLPVLASMRHTNISHFVFNNCAHETVGGMPTVSTRIDYQLLARACGYSEFYSASSECGLKDIMNILNERRTPGPILCEIKVRLGARSDLGRPTESPLQCKEQFMRSFEDQ
jgi:phosphonopyruvate decarboxylase